MTIIDEKAIDKELGARVRQMRIARKFSQEALGKGCDVTFQQVQKYEAGTNRISFSRLIQIARTLQVDPIIFLEGLRPDEGGAETMTATTLLTENKLLKERLADIRKLATL